MGVHDNMYRAYSELHDLRKFMDDVEFWSHCIDARRAIAFSNYKIGQEQKLKKK